MTLQPLPELKISNGLKWHIQADALDRWNPVINAASSSNNEIDILDVIGADFWGEGVTSKRISAALRSIGDNDVIVNINSPGGDLFEGVTIYNQLRLHSHKVTVRVLGMAASAASIIAMAGDEVQIGKNAMFMVHNAWTFTGGNRHELRSMADMLDITDASMANVYADRTGIDQDTISKMMDAETYLSGEMAVEQAFADAFLPADIISEGNEDRQAAKAKTVIENSLKVTNPNMSRSKRLALLSEANTVKPGADDEAKLCAGLADLIETIRA